MSDIDDDVEELFAADSSDSDSQPPHSTFHQTSTLVETSSSGLEPQNQQKPTQKPQIVRKRLILPKHGVNESNKTITLCKFPPFLAVEEKPFDAETYAEGEDAKPAPTTIRWRYKRDLIGELTTEIESNSKIVQYSDGSLLLLVGDEAFELNKVQNFDSGLCQVFASLKDTENLQPVLSQHGVISSESKISVLKNANLASKNYREKMLELELKGKNLRKVKMVQTEVLENPEALQDAKAKAKEEALRLENMKSRRKNKRRSEWNEDYFEQFQYESNRSKFENITENENETSVKKLKNDVKAKADFLSSSEESAAESGSASDESIALESEDDGKEEADEVGLSVKRKNVIESDAESD